LSIFAKKLDELILLLNTTPTHSMTVTSLDYLDCLRIVPENSIIYADPPYSAVHYSRFYHVIETLVRYDHPHLEYKGRYRDDRHQSPFDKRKEVTNAFQLLFKAVDERKSHLVLSYSDNGLLKFDELLEIGERMMGNYYDISYIEKTYIHSKMGRSDENRLDVNELLFSFRRR
jgi:adenine-specific DNA-methyltransferase